MTTAASQLIFDAIGTKWIIDMSDVPDELPQTRLSAAIHKRVNEFDSRFSRFRGGTMIDRISKSAGAYIIEPSERPLIGLYRTLYNLTDGYFTPLIGQTLSDAGYDKDYSLKSKKHISPVEKWDDVLDYNDGSLTVRKPVLLDFGGAGKGFIIDEISTLLKQAGIGSFCVDAGGDMYYYNTKNIPLEVGLEHPENEKQIIGSVEVLNSGICGSSGNRRSWGKYHHIINPRTLTSPDHIKSVWVIAASAMLADALATCLFFVPPKKLSQFSFQYLILNNDFTIDKSDQFPAKLYYNKT